MSNQVLDIKLQCALTDVSLEPLAKVLYAFFRNNKAYLTERS